MSITRAQQQALDDALIPREHRLQIGSCNYRLSTVFKHKELTFQVALDVFSLTPFLSSLLDHCKCPCLEKYQESIHFVFLGLKSYEHEVVQKYDAILPDYLTNQAMKESESYKTYHDLATGKVQPKPKYIRRSSRSKTKKSPKPFPGKRVKATVKVAKSRNKKQPTLRLETLSEVALTEAEQLKLATKLSLIQTHNSHTSGSGAHEGTGVKPGVLDIPTYRLDEEEISWKSSDEEDDDDEANIGKNKDDNDQEDDDNTDHDDDNERTDLDNDGDNFVHPKFSTYDDKANDEDNDDEIQGANVKGEDMDEEATNKEEEHNELYRDVNVNLTQRDVEMTDAQ
nr:hypothetical protein [Tanacetum cinerariifolium]